MVINEEVKEILKENNIPINKGLIYLLCIFHNIDVNNVVIDEKIITTINSLKICERDYKNKTIIWNIPLYEGHNNEVDWIKEWMIPFGKMNPDRKGTYQSCLRRMQKFMIENPQYNKEDIIIARDLYLRSISNATYVMKSHKFIEDGIGTQKKSELLEYCEKIREQNNNNSNMVGELM